MSQRGCDACANDYENKTIWVADAKSSQNGVNAAANPAGEPLTRLQGWLKQDWASGKTATAENKAFADEMARLIDENGFEIKGLTIKVGVPKPGTTGKVEVKVLPWGN